MKKHTKIYMDHFGYDKTDFIGCEVCGTIAVDIHHMDSKGMGGSKTKDYIENLIAVCRNCHNQCHDSKDFNNNAKEIHLTKL
jgi:predicted HNH restriction endonuclease